MKQLSACTMVRSDFIAVHQSTSFTTSVRIANICVRSIGNYVDYHKPIQDESLNAPLHVANSVFCYTSDAVMPLHKWMGQFFTVFPNLSQWLKKFVQKQIVVGKILTRIKPDSIWMGHFFWKNMYI